MYITRKPPFPLTLSYDGLDESTEYTVAIMNDYASDLVEIPVTSNISGSITTPLPDYFSRYDSEYRVEIMDGTDVVLIDTLTVARPYVDPSTLAETEEDIADATSYEALARAIVDGITGGFKYQRSSIEAIGFGSDYIPLSMRVNKIIKVYENNALVYDLEPTDPDWVNLKEYYITPDRTAITMSVSGTGTYNRREYKPVTTRMTTSDSFEPYDGTDEGNRHEPIMDRGYSFFPMGWDYVLVLDTGWPVVPNDIKQATTMLYNDLKCNNLPYINSYIKEYESGQFTLKFNDLAFTKTGNRLVDNILSNYSSGLGRIGVI